MKLLIIILAALAFILGGVAQAEQPAGEKTGPPQDRRFVDLDGDGLNDNTPDLNHDGIPDFDIARAPEPPMMTLRGAANIFEQIEQTIPVTSMYLSKSERFQSLRFCARSLLQCRGGFAAGEDFGPGNGIGQGALSGNCTGGICRF